MTPSLALRHSEAARMTAGPRDNICLALNKQMEVCDRFLPAKLPAEGWQVSRALNRRVTTAKCQMAGKSTGAALAMDV